MVDRKIYGYSVDWWGLGVILYFMMTGRVRYVSLSILCGLVGSRSHTLYFMMTGRVRYVSLSILGELVGSRSQFTS